MQGGESKPVDNNEPPSDEKNERGNDIQAPPSDNGNPSLPSDDNGSHGSGEAPISPDNNSGFDEAPTPPDNNGDFGGGHPGDGNDPGRHGGMDEPGYSDHVDMSVPQDDGNAPANHTTPRDGLINR